MTLPKIIYTHDKEHLCWLQYDDKDTFHTKKHQNKHKYKYMYQMLIFDYHRSYNKPGWADKS